MRANPAELKMRSRAAISDKSNKAVWASVVMFILWFAMSWLTTRLSGYADWATDYYDMAYAYLTEGGALVNVAWPRVAALSAVLCVLIYAMQSVLRAGYVSWCMMAARGMQPTIRDIFNGFYSFWRVIVLTLLRGVLIYVGLALFVVPGLILLYRYRLSFFVLHDNPELSPVQCMRESARLTRGRRTEMFMLDLSFFGWWIFGAFVGSVTVPVVDLWLRPYYGLTYACYYDFVIANDRSPDAPV